MQKERLLFQFLQNVQNCLARTSYRLRQQSFDFTGFRGVVPVSIDILDSSGKLVRSYSSEESDFERCLTHNMDPRSPYEPKYPSAKAGLNKWNWDTKRQGFTCVEDMTLFEGLNGTSVPPGDYEARLSAGGPEVPMGEPGFHTSRR